MAKRYSTSTVRSDGAIVPWLAAEGPLAYSPENPPDSNYFFQYSLLMPGVYRDKRHLFREAIVSEPSIFQLGHRAVRGLLGQGAPARSSPSMS